MAELSPEVKEFVNGDMRPHAEKIRKAHNELEIALKNAAVALDEHYSNNFDGAFATPGDTVTTPNLPVLLSEDLANLLWQNGLIIDGNFVWDEATKDIIEKICTRTYEV